MTSATQKAMQAITFTNTYRRYQDKPIAIREAMCLQAQFPAVLVGIKDGDLLVGRIDRGLVGFSIDEWGQQAFGYYCLFAEIEQLLEDEELHPSLKSQLRAVTDFWKTEHTAFKVREAYPRKMATALPSDDWMGSSGIAFPLYRLTGGNINYQKLLKFGIPGLFQEVEEKEKAAQVRGEKDLSFYKGLKIALQVFSDVCFYFADSIEKQINEGIIVKRKAELRKLVNILRRLPDHAPQGFYEAVQLFWLYALISDIRNHGRMDVYLGSFYVQDLKNGVLTKEEGIKILASLWRLMAARNTVVHNRVIIGGVGRDNEADADEFALLAMEATRIVKETEPQLSLRFYTGMDSRLMEKALSTIGEGCTYPILYNDDVNIEAIQKALKVDREEALQYVPFGCGEYIIDHKGFGTPSGVINLLKALEVTIRNGRDPLTGKIIGLQLGEFNSFQTFEQLWQAYKRQVEYFVEILAEQQVIEYKVAAKTGAFLYPSLLYDDCLERGKPLFRGGVRYLGGTLETYGNTNVADSLFAIKELVYKRAVFGQAELLKILDANYEGYEQERRLILRLPKYGNDLQTVDSMAQQVHEHVCKFTKKQSQCVGLHSYSVVVINNSANTLMGKWTAASPDGRKAGEPMANGNNPSGGSDQQGVTAFLNSLVKLDPTIHAGAVQNMKFSRLLFTEHRNIVRKLLQVYFAQGGAQAMVTVVSREELEKAMREPEKFRHVMVRVGGFSARFVELSPDVQKEILSRTLY